MPAFKLRTSRLVIGFYRKAEHAEEAHEEARKNHFRRSWVVQRAEDGSLKSVQGRLEPANRALLGIGVSVLLALLAGRFGANLPGQAVAAIGGFLLIWFGLPWFGLSGKALRYYGRFVLPGRSEEHTS